MDGGYPMSFGSLFHPWSHGHDESVVFLHQQQNIPIHCINEQLLGKAKEYLGNWENHSDAF